MEKRNLGRSGIEVGRIGISSSYGADIRVFDEALDRGCNYFNWGTFIKGRSAQFRKFMNQISADKKRDQVVLGLLSYSHSALLGDFFLNSALKQLRTDYIDCLILGYYPKRPPERVLNWALKLKEEGVIRAIGLTTHKRSIVAELCNDPLFDFFHFRYNAVHRGAEKDIFPYLGSEPPGMISFTATSWGQLLQQKKMKSGVMPPSAGDCYRFVLSRDEVDVCMMGVRDIDMLRQNMEVIERGQMSSAELESMRSIGDHLYGKPRT